MTVDRFVVGAGMVPRGEVGLIFASIGLANGVLDNDQYGALVAVVLLTTIMAPSALRWRLGAADRRGAPQLTVVAEPEQGWLAVADGVIDVRSTPGTADIIPLALRIAALTDRARPSDELLGWFSATAHEPLTWRTEHTELLVRLLRDDNPRAWRFLDVSGVLERAAPELNDELQRRRCDLSDLDPLGSVRFPVVERVDQLTHRFGLPSDVLIIAAFVSDVCPTSDADRAALTDRLVDGTTATLVLSLIADARLLRSGVARQVTFDDRDDRQLALHLASAVHAREAHALALALAPLSERQAALLEARMTRVIDELTRPDLAGGSSGDLAASRRLAAERLVHHQPQVVNRLRSGDDDWLLSFAPEELARQAQLVEPVPAKTTVRVAVTPDDTPERWRIDIAAFDRPGLLARITTALFETGLEVIEANVSSWPDGAALDSFVVQATHRPNARAFAEHLERLLSQSEPRWTIGGLSADIDNETLPWHTLVVVTGPNRAGVLAAMCSAFSTSGITVHTARIVSHGEHVANRFAVTDRLGRKLDDRAVVHLRAALAGTRPARRSIVSSLRGQRSLSGAVRSLS